MTKEEKIDKRIERVERLADKAFDRREEADKKFESLCLEIIKQYKEYQK